MRALTCARRARFIIRVAQHQQPLLAWAAARRQHVTRAARSPARASLNGRESSSSSSSSSSAANGWLLDPPASLAPASSSSSNNGSKNSSSNSSDEWYDAIMVLGGGLFPDAGLPVWVLRRLEGSLHLYTQQQALHAASQQATVAVAAAAMPTSNAAWRQLQPWAAAAPGPCPIVLLGAATPHKPPIIDDQGYVLYESTAYAEYLMGRGVPAADLLKETQSCDTVGNGYFSLLQHALPAGWRSIAVVTSEFHMPRTQATFDFIYSLAASQLHGDPGWYRLHYRAVSDEALFHPEVIEARAIKEAAAVATWHKNTAGMRSLADLHSWLYATHLCYSVSRQGEFGKTDLDPKLAATY